MHPPELSELSSLESARTIQNENIQAAFLPKFGMLGASIKFHNHELLRRIEDLSASALKGSTAGLPFLYPWANRLEAFNFTLAGKQIALDRNSPFIHLDEQGLPNHGIPWSMLNWSVIDCTDEELTAGLDWKADHLLNLFPFSHSVQMRVKIYSKTLRIETEVTADESVVPISFGYHPYFGFPNSSRKDWKLKLPPMNALVLDNKRIPSGRRIAFHGFDDQLGNTEFDDGYELIDQQCSFSLEGSGFRITLQFVEGYTHAQVFAPKQKEFVALEPMCAPANALISSTGLNLLDKGEKFRAVFELSFDQI